MILDGMELLGNTDALNFAVDSGIALATSGKRGELFYLYGDEETIGLYAHTGSEWTRIGAKEFKLVAGNGINYDNNTKTISTNIPVNATNGQILATRNGSLVWVTFTKNDVGLDKVDNTSDANKPVSNATQAVLDTKVDKNNPIFNGEVIGLSKENVGLANVDNTSDLGKPISNATQDALDLKANIDSPAFTGIVSGISKGMVGLSNVDNTSDANKPISTAAQTALDLTEKKANKNVANGYVGLDVNLKINPAYLPASAGVQGITVSNTGSSTGIAASISGTTTNPILNIANDFTNSGVTTQRIYNSSVIELVVNSQVIAAVSLNKSKFFSGLQETILTNTANGSYYFTSGSSIYEITLAANSVYTIEAPSVDNKGSQFTLIQKQTGSKTVTWPSSIRWAGGTAPTITAVAGKADVFSFVCNGTYWIGFPCGLNFTL